MEEENVSIKVAVSNTELGKSGELIKNVMIDIPNNLASNADVLIIGITVEGYTINAMSLLETLAHAYELKGAILGYEKNE